MSGRGATDARHRVDAILARIRPDGAPLYADDVQRATFTAMMLQIMTEAPLDKMDAPTQELVVMAMAEAGLHPEMTQDEWNLAILRYVERNAPDLDLLAELSQAIAPKR